MLTHLEILHQYLFSARHTTIYVACNLELNFTALDFGETYNHHHHHISVMELGHLLTRSSLTYLEVSSKICYDSFWQVMNSVFLTWVIYYEEFYLHVVSSFSCIPLICPKLVLYLTPLQFVYLFCNLSQCTLLFFSCISFLLLLFFWRPLGKYRLKEISEFNPEE